MRPATAFFTIIGALLVIVLAMIGALAIARSHRDVQYRDPHTTVGRSCYANRCVQLMPGGLLRWTTPDGTVLRVEWRR